MKWIGQDRTGRTTGLHGDESHSRRQQRRHCNSLGPTGKMIVARTRVWVLETEKSGEMQERHWRQSIQEYGYYWGKFFCPFLMSSPGSRVFWWVGDKTAFLQTIAHSAPGKKWITWLGDGQRVFCLTPHLFTPQPCLDKPLHVPAHPRQRWLWLSLPDSVVQSGRPYDITLRYISQCSLYPKEII